MSRAPRPSRTARRAPGRSPPAEQRLKKTSHARDGRPKHRHVPPGPLLRCSAALRSGPGGTWSQVPRILDPNWLDLVRTGEQHNRRGTPRPRRFCRISGENASRSHARSSASGADSSASIECARESVACTSALGECASGSGVCTSESDECASASAECASGSAECTFDSRAHS